MHADEFDVKAALFELYKLSVNYRDDVSKNASISLRDAFFCRSVRRSPMAAIFEIKIYEKHILVIICCLDCFWKTHRMNYC